MNKLKDRFINKLKDIFRNEGMSKPMHTVRRRQNNRNIKIRESPEKFTNFKEKKII